MSLLILVKTEGTGIVHPTGYGTLGGADADYLTGMVTDSSDNIYISGYTKSSGVVGANNFYVAKYNSSGVLQWQKTLSDTTNFENTWAYEIDIDAAENYVYVVGRVDVNYAPYTAAVWAKYATSNGALQWQKLLDGSRQEQFNDIYIENTEIN